MSDPVHLDDYNDEQNVVIRRCYGGSDVTLFAPMSTLLLLLLPLLQLLLPSFFAQMQLRVW